MLAELLALSALSDKGDNPLLKLISENKMQEKIIAILLHKLGDNVLISDEEIKWVRELNNVGIVTYPDKGGTRLVMKSVKEATAIAKKYHGKKSRKKTAKKQAKKSATSKA